MTCCHSCNNIVHFALCRFQSERKPRCSGMAVSSDRARNFGLESNESFLSVSSGNADHLIGDGIWYLGAELRMRERPAVGLAVRASCEPFLET